MPLLNNGGDVDAANDEGFTEPEVDLREERYANADDLCEIESTDNVNKVEVNSEDLILHGNNILPSSEYFPSESEFTNPAPPETLFIESDSLDHVHGEVKQKESDKTYMTQDGSNAIHHIKQYPDNLTPSNRVEKVETENRLMSLDSTTNGECDFEEVGSKFPEKTGGSPHAVGESQGEEICSDEADEHPDVTGEGSSETQGIHKTGGSSADRTEEGHDETEGLGNHNGRLDEAGVGASETEKEANETNSVEEDSPELASQHNKAGEPGVTGESPDVRGEEAPCSTEEVSTQVEESPGEVEEAPCKLGLQKS